MSGLEAATATERDRGDLAAFECGRGLPHLDEVGEYIRRRALDEFLSKARSPNHRLLIIRDDSGELVAVAAYEPNWRVTVGDEPVAGSELLVVAISAPYQSTRQNDGRSTFRTVLEMVLDDIAGNDGGPVVAMCVADTNAKMLGICRQIAGVAELGMSSGYRMFVVGL